MNTLLNDRAFMAVFEKSKLEAKQRALQNSDLMVEGIYARMFVDLSGWVDTNQQVQQQQRKLEKLQLQEQALPFIIETDGTTEVCAATKQDAQSIDAQINESPLINQQQEEKSKPPELPAPEVVVVVKEEFTDSVTIIKDLPSLRSPQLPKPKENNRVLLNSIAAQKDDTRNNVAQNAAHTQNKTSNNVINKSNIIIAKKFYGRRNQIDNNNNNNYRINKKNSNIIIRNINTTTNNKNDETNNVINRNINNQSIASICIANDNDTEMNCGCPECLRKEKGSKNKVGHSKGSKEEEANNVEMVDPQNQHEVGARLFECSNCNLRFISDLDLQIHSAVHKNKSTLKCDLCQKQFRDKRTFEKHLKSKSVHKQQPLILICEICSKQFNRLYNYTRHMATVHSVHEKTEYECRFCKRKFTQDHIRRNHEKAVHQKIRPFRCTWKGCRFVSACRANVVSHVGAIHFGVPQKEQRKMAANGANDDGVHEFEKYVRKVPEIVAARRHVKTKKKKNK